MKNGWCNLHHPFCYFAATFSRSARFSSALRKAISRPLICAWRICSRDNPASPRGNGIFVNDIHSLYAGIVSVNAGTNAMLKERFQWMQPALLRCWSEYWRSDRIQYQFCCSARKSISARSSMAFTPCPIRSAPSSRIACQMLSGPAASPAWTVICQPASRARLK